LDFIIQILIILFKLFYYICLGILNVFFGSTKQQKFTLFLFFTVFFVDAYIICPKQINWGHVAVAFTPFIYLIKLGKGG